MQPVDLATEDTLAFLRTALPQSGARILEVGCGRGALAARLLGDGREVTPIDSSAEAVRAAEALGVPAREADFRSFEGGPFDVVLFTRSLHHIHPLAAAIERAHRLLEPDGVLILEEFAWDEVDRATATWLYDIEALLEAAGALRVNPHAAPQEGDPLSRWHADHAHHEPLHGGGAMLSAIEERFELERVERVPYFYRSVIDRLTGDAASSVGARMLWIERLRIEQGLIRPAGLRVVARRR
jgi:SAM-dependent methyltransferase